MEAESQMGKGMGDMRYWEIASNKRKGSVI